MLFLYIFAHVSNDTYFPLSKGAKTEPSSKEGRHTSKQTLETETIKKEVKLSKFTVG